MKGTYIFYENGKEVYRSSNVITRFGRRFLTNVIAGNADAYKKDIAIGIGPTAASIDDTRLQFEWYRLPVIFGSTDIQTVDNTTTYSVIYKTTLPQNIAGQIKEIGLYPSKRQSINEFDDKFISDFSDALTWSSAEGDLPQTSYNGDIVYSKIGDSVLDFQSTSGTPKEYFLNGPMDISGYSANDSITASYYAYDSHLSSIRVRFYSSSDAYFELSIPAVSGTGHKITSDILLSSLFNNSINNPDATKIIKVGVAAVPTSGQTTKIGMDGIRINDEDTFDPIYGIISRSVLSEAITKYAGRQLDIEYKVDLGYGN